MKRIIMDLDETICSKGAGSYADAALRPHIKEKLEYYKGLGFQIVISTSRNMRTYEGNVGKITANTLPIILSWLSKHEVPYDEIYVGKPWCGEEGFYVDDKSIRPDEFERLSYDEIKKLVGIKK